jgi:hypothetical protein
VHSQFPPFSAARSTTTPPGLMASIISLVIKTGAFLPGIRAVVIMISTSLAYCIKSSISALINSGDISLAYPPVPSPDSFILTSKNSAPKDLNCSLTASLVSNPLTMAPRDLAVAIADKPATPPPITKTYYIKFINITLAGGNFPAAVI